MKLDDTVGTPDEAKRGIAPTASQPQLPLDGIGKQGRMPDANTNFSISRKPHAESAILGHRVGRLTGKGPLAGNGGNGVLASEIIFDLLVDTPEDLARAETMLRERRLD